jgi:4-diphosphocytidyl-2-C-methyl-D-erythritol kinase
MVQPLYEPAAAKLNLALSVGPPGPDRMHPICSWMVTVDLFDDLTLTKLPEGSLSRFAILWHDDAPKRSEIDWPITRDLAVRAHQSLERYVGRSLPVQLKLQKRIPVGGGLGGGSSDAAAMLRGLNQLFALGLTSDELATIGGSLGSDIPFLIRGGSAVVEGFGENVQTLDTLPKLDAVLVFPEDQCPTGLVYGAFDAIDGAVLQRERVVALAERRAIGHADPFNDLGRPAMTVAPNLVGAMAAVAEIAGRAVHVSGSGSTLFVVCDDASHARKLADRIDSDGRWPARAVAATGAAGG